jgi:hypothetical protein
MEQAEGIQQNIAPGSPTNSQDVGEPMIKQSEVNELLGKAKHAYYEKGKREALETSQQPSQSQGGGSMGGMPQLTEEQVRQMIADEAHKQTQLAAAHNMLSSFAEQMKAGKGKYSDFDETVAQLGPLQNLTHVVQLAHDTGMGGDVMYELGRNPGKVATLTTLAYVNPHLAKVEMNKLAESIRKNEAAAQTPQADEPLDQVKPSTVGTDNGTNAVRDLRRKRWAQG